MADLGDAGEVVRYLVGFWAFLFSPKYRTSVRDRWRQADASTRGLMVVEGLVATIVGLGLPLLLVSLFSQAFPAA